MVGLDYWWGFRIGAVGDIGFMWGRVGEGRNVVLNSELGGYVGVIGCLVWWRVWNLEGFFGISEISIFIEGK